MASKRQNLSRRSTKAKSPASSEPRPLNPFTIDHFRQYASLMVFDDGEQREPEDWQLAIAEDIFAGYREVWQITPEGNGKALDVLTPLPLASGGYVLMRDVKAGDRLVGSDGRSVGVTATSDVMLGRQCFELTFSDGATVVADAEHLWSVEGAHDDYRPRTLTTQQLRDTGVTLNSGARRWRVNSATRAGVEADLPIDPYVLGVWLGDGACDGGRVTNVDPEVWERIEQSGSTLGRQVATRVRSHTILGLQGKLRELGLLGDKRIPTPYLDASQAQRLALLQGLMDTDGTVSKAGQATYYSTNRRLADDVRQLAWTLGLSAFMDEDRAKLYGVDMGPCFKLTIACDAQTPIVSIPRKVTRLKASGKTCRHRRIVSIEQVTSRPVRCIQVNAPDRLFQAGLAGILTHNSTFIAQLALYGADYSESPWIPIGAASAKQARIVYDQAAGFVERTEGMMERFRCFGGYKLIRSLRNGGIGIEVFAADVKTGDGVIPFPYALLDELHRQQDLRLYNLWKGKLRKRGAQILAISTAGEPDTPFENIRDTIRRQATKRKRVGAHLRAEGPGLVFHEWMVASDDACKDMEAVKSANPLSTISVQSLTEDFNSPTLDLGDWKRLKCNRPTRSAQTAITDKEWDDAQVEAEIPAKADVDIGLDVAWKWDTTALVPLWRAEGYRLLGEPQILVPPRDGSSMHPDRIKDAFLEFQGSFKIGTVVMDISKAEDISAWIEDELGVVVIDRGQSNQFAVADFEAFMDGLRNGTLKHTGHPGMRSHVLNAIARRLPGGDYRFDRPSAVRGNAREQDRRVIDALTAAGMVVEFSNRDLGKQTSVYAERDLVVA